MLYKLLEATLLVLKFINLLIYLKVDYIIIKSVTYVFIVRQLISLAYISLSLVSNLLAKFLVFFIVRSFTYIRTFLLRYLRAITFISNFLLSSTFFLYLALVLSRDSKDKLMYR